MVKIEQLLQIKKMIVIGNQSTQYKLNTSIAI